MDTTEDSSRLTLDKSIDPIEFCHQQGWTDGLPVVAPTVSRVEAMLATVERNPSELLGNFKPLGGRVTVEKAAVNSVLAGCLPEYFPVVLTAVECLANRQDSLGIFLTTIHGDSPLVVINGPIVKQLNFNAGSNVFGPGRRANATVGRAVSLILRNLASGPPGEFDNITFAHPGKYSYCIAEYEEASPWDAFHLERGFSQSESTVTLLAAQAPIIVADMVSTSGESLLKTVADTMSVKGSYNMYFGGEILIVVSPTHAQILANEGWRKEDVCRFLFNAARKPLHELQDAGSYNFGDLLRWPDWVDTSDKEYPVPVAHQPEDILLMVAGGEVGSYTCVIFCFHAFRSITKAITSANRS